MVIYANGEVKVEVSDYSACIKVKGTPKPLYLTLPELAGIAGAIVAYLKRKAELEYEDFAWPPAGEA